MPAEPGQLRNVRAGATGYRVAHGWIADEVYARLEREAFRRRMHPDSLTALMLTLIATDDLYASILDV